MKEDPLLQVFLWEAGSMFTMKVDGHLVLILSLQVKRTKLLAILVSHLKG